MSVEWRVVEKFRNGLRYRKFIDGKPTNSYKLELVSGDPALDLQVEANLDDVHEVEQTGEVIDGSNYVIHASAFAAGTRAWGGHRWVSGALPPQGSTIDVCYAQLYIPSDAVDDINGNWHFEKAASPAQFSTDDFDVTGRTRTTASVSDVHDSVGVGWYQTESLVTPLQEVINAYSPTALALIFRPNQDVTKYLYSRSHNYDGDLAAKIHIEYTAAPVDVQVGASGDDYRRYDDSGFSSTDTVPYLGYFPTEHRHQGYRFTSVNVPQGSIINVAYLSIQNFDKSLDVPVVLTIYGNDVDDAVAPTTASEFDNLVLTSEYVVWYNSDLSNDTFYNSPSIVDIVQEIVNRSGWAANNAIQFIIKSTGPTLIRWKRVWHYDISTTRCPKLHIEYTEITAYYVDVPTRFRLWARAFKDVATRLKLQVRNFVDIPTRFKVTAREYADTATRFLLSANTYKDAASRFKLTVQNYQDTAARFILNARNYSDVATRFVLQVAADISTRFKLTVRGFTDIATRFKLEEVGNFSDIATRFKLWVPSGGGGSQESMGAKLIAGKLI